ncbi:MAG: hypothetical protein ACFCGT_21130 [Sandaracinaceae bacterium]
MRERWAYGLAAAMAAWSVGVAGSAAAQVDGAVGVAGTASNLEAGGEIDARIRFDRGLQLGLTVRGARSYETYVGGFAEGDGATVEGLGHALVPWFTSEALEVGLRMAVGVRRTFVDTAQGPFDASTRLTTDLGPLVALNLDPHLTVRLGWTTLVELELDPTTEIARLGQRLTLGVLVPIDGGVSVVAEVGAAGTFGFDGDNEKVLFDGVLGLRWAFGPGAADWRLF